MRLAGIRYADGFLKVSQEILTQDPGAKLDVLIADLESKADTIGLAEAFYQRYDGLDVLVNNAGSAFFISQHET